MTYTHPQTAATIIIAASDSVHPERADYPCNGIDDQNEINTALALEGDVYLLDGVYHTSGKIEVPENTKLILSSGAEIRPASSFDVVELHGSLTIGVLCGSIQGGRIDVRPLGAGNFTHCAILIDDAIGGNNSLTFSNINLIGHQGAGNGTGLALKAGDGSRIYSLTARDINILGFEKSIALTATGTGWINGNHFLNIYMKGSQYAMYLERETGAIQGNSFKDFEYQTTSDSERLIYCEGTYNLFTGVFWDWEASALSMDFAEFTSDSRQNQLFYNGIGHGDIVVVKNDGIMNHVIRTEHPYGGHSVTVGRYVGDYHTLAEAMASLSGQATYWNRGKITVYGTVTETAQLTALDHVDVIGENNATVFFEDVDNNAIDFSNIDSAKWSNISFIHKDFLGTGTDSVLYIHDVEQSPTYPNTTPQVTFKNCHFLNDHRGTSPQTGVTIHNFVNARFINCTARGSRNAAAQSAGWSFQGIGNATPILDNCTGHGTKMGSAGFLISFANSPVLNNCVAVPGPLANSYGFDIQHNAAPFLNNCAVIPNRSDYYWYYLTTNNGQFRPFATIPYQIYAINIQVINALAGGTLDIGTSIGGTEIATNIDISSTGFKFFPITQAEIAGNGYMYATPSSPISNNDIRIYYNVAYNYADNYAIHLNTKGHAKIEGGNFIVNGASDCVYIALNTLDWEINNATLETLDRTNQYSVNAYAALSNIPILNSALIGPTNNITSYLGSTVGTNALRP